LKNANVRESVVKGALVTHTFPLISGIGCFLNKMFTYRRKTKFTLSTKFIQVQLKVKERGEFFKIFHFGKLFKKLNGFNIFYVIKRGHKKGCVPVSRTAS
jgi:hypothetical protein